jgi:hypothetical protein
MSNISSDALWLVIGFIAGCISGVLACFVALGGPLGSERRASAGTAAFQVAAPAAAARANGSNRKKARSLTQAGPLTTEQRRARIDFASLQDDTVGGFVDRVGHLPLADWITIGRVAAACQSVAPTPASVYAQVQQALTSNRLLFRAWEIRDAIDSLVIRRRGAVRLTADDVSLLTTASSAVRDAALALLLRDYLPSTVVEAQCAPCAPLIRVQPAIGA